ncbi:MAG: hypothetical protein AB7U81_00185 [Thiohalomonadaceae bacterium]
MTLDVSSLSMPVAALIASLIGATATITASLIQLRIAWRKEIKARESRAPVTKKTRRGPVAAVLVLTVASAVGGFALSQYFTTRGREAALSMEAELRARLAQLDQLAARLERASGAHDEADAPPAATPAAQDHSVIAAVTLAACVVRSGADELPCSEADAERVTLCAGLPPGTRPVAVERYVREQDDPSPWSQAQLAPGEHPVNGRVVGEPGPGADPQTVCQEFMHWGSTGRTARLRVSYTDAPLPVQQVVVESAAGQ